MPSPVFLKPPCRQRPVAIAPVLLGIASLSLPGLISPALAHQVQIQDAIGATLHIEPNDIPLAGQPTDLWFALTQAGGTVIPLDTCDCALTVYDTSETVVEAPPLSPVSAEGYTDIPGAVVTFPAVGAYELVLTGAAKDGASGGPVENSATDSTQFAPFELRFEVTVAGRASGSASPPVTEPDDAQADTPTSADQPATPPVVASGSPPNSVATSGTLSSSAIVRRSAPWIGAVLAVCVLVGLIGGLRSPGGKS